MRMYMGKSEGKRPVARSRGKWKENKNGSARNTVNGVVWIHLAQDKGRSRGFVNKVMHLQVS